MNVADPLVAVAAILSTLLLGAYLVALLDDMLGAGLGGDGVAFHPAAPLWRAIAALSRQELITERPDALNWRLAPAFLLALAAAGLAVVPWSRGFVPVDIPTGLVLWGAVEVLATVVIFLYGWSANGHFPLLGAYRYVSLGLSYMLVSMFVLIGVALPAESLQVSAVVEAQNGVWNVVRQPLGLPLFLVVGLGLCFWGPLNFVQADDLAGGAAADASGPRAAIWELARKALLVAFSFIAASAFLGGWLGPWLPGPVWLVLKALLVLGLLLLLGRCLPRVSPDRFMSLAWVLLLPLSFLDLVWAGVLAQW